MASPGVGAKSYIQWGREAVWGTAVAATKRAGFIRHTIRPVIKQEKSQLLNGNLVADTITNVLESAEGQLEMYLTYNDLMLFFDCAMGTATFGASGGATAGALPYTHTWTDAMEFYNSLTLELIEGDIPATKCQRVLGAKVVGFTIRGEAAGFVHVIFDIVGMRLQTNQTPTGALTANTPLIVQTAHMSVFDDGLGDAAADAIIKSFEFTHKNGAAKREICGTNFIGEPIRDGQTTCTLKWRKEFRTRTALQAYIAGTAAAPTFTLTTSSLAIFDVDTFAAKVVSHTRGVDTFGIMYEEVEVEGLLTEGSPDQCAKIIITNSQPLITT